VTQVVAWAAGNGDRSENADYHTESDGCARSIGAFAFSPSASMPPEIVDPQGPRTGRAATQIFFGATVRYSNAAGEERVVSIVGSDEVDLALNYISWVSPLARALMKAGAGDRVRAARTRRRRAPALSGRLVRAYSRRTVPRAAWSRVRSEENNRHGSPETRLCP
jgi:transcription elongation GreA/GreB family factor